MVSRPLPVPDENTAAFWTAGKAGKLVLQRCQSCDRLQFYPRAMCATCLSDSLEWIEASGKGQLYSHTTVHRALMPGFEDAVPYVVALVELDEGVRLLCQLVNCEPEEAFVGMRVAVVFEQISDQIVIPNVQPLGDDGRNA